MADFFKYLWHCIWESLSCLTGYGPDDLSWKDFWVAISLILLFLAIEFLVLLKVRVFRKNEYLQDNSTEEDDLEETIVITDEEEEKSESMTTTNKIWMFKYSVYLLVLGGIMLCLLIAILLMSLLFNKPLVMSDLAMLVIYCGIFIVLTIIMAMTLSQCIIVDSDGIKVTSMKKILTSIQWDEITNIEVEYYLKIPMYKVTLLNGKSYSFIQRKKFKSAIITYGNENIQQLITDGETLHSLTQDNTLNNENNSEVVSVTNYTKKNKIRMIKNSVYMIALGIIMMCLLIAILLMTLLSNKPINSDKLAMLVLFWVIFIVMTIVMIMTLVQIIIIDSSGIKITCFNKVLTSIQWDEIASIEVDYQFNMPMYKMILFNGKSFSFIKRKKFKLAIITYGNDKIQQLMDALN